MTTYVQKKKKKKKKNILFVVLEKKVVHLHIFSYNKVTENYAEICWVGKLKACFKKIDFLLFFSEIITVSS